MSETGPPHDPLDKIGTPMLQCNWQAVCASVLLFVVPYALIVVSASLLMPPESDGLATQVLAYAALPIIAVLIGAGYAAARMAGVSGVANGAAVGLIVSVVLLIGPYLCLNLGLGVQAYVQQYGPHALVMGIFWCSLGGLIRELIANHRLA